jgi:hypothetical protein
MALSGAIGETLVRTGVAGLESNAGRAASPSGGLRFAEVLAAGASPPPAAAPQAPFPPGDARLPRMAPVREVGAGELPAGDRRNALGDKMIQQADRVHQGDVTLRRGASDPIANNAVKVVLPPGPAARSPADTRVEGSSIAVDDGFDAQIRNLKALYDQAIHVSLLTKSTGSFNSTLNKLISAQ